MRRYVPAELRDAARSILTAFGFIWRAEIEPDRVLDDLGREAMAAVAQGSHADILREVRGAGYCAYRTRRLRRTTKKTAPSPEASRLIVPGSGTAGGLSGSAMVRSYS
jgi:hypothetical protein